MNPVKATVLFGAAAAMLGGAIHRTPASAKNIVLVHGAWVDGSGWKSVYEILTSHGFTVTLVQEPLTSFAEDVAAVRRVLDQQQGPTVLVGHSYGGSVITEAGTHPRVVGLVYIAAHMPDTGESESADGKRFPSAATVANLTRKTPDGFTFLDRAKFPTYFAADLPRRAADFQAQAQILTAASVFTGQITTPAWGSKPSSMMVAGADKIISPELERWYAKRAGSHTVEIPGASHSVYMSHPREVAALIEEAARSSR
ncbi:MAG TPA: alpha/beta hydrolase [Gemmatimonadaceae bacterium]|jgi:pimeloyl-ACP methyl ester carboxylesterase